MQSFEFWSAEVERYRLNHPYGIRELCLPEPVDLVTANFDTLNHLVTLADLRLAFRRVAENLRSGGWFYFDVVTPCRPFGGLRTYRRAHCTARHSMEQRVRWEPERGLIRIQVVHRQAGCTSPVIELHTERAYAPSDVGHALLDAGLVNHALVETSRWADLARWIQASENPGQQGQGVNPAARDFCNQLTSSPPATAFPMAFDRERIKKIVAALAAKGVFIGTSSWKYQGWLGQLYTPRRYHYRGKVAKTRFERDCLSEYAQVFKTVCVDAAYYTFPRPEYLQNLAEAVPDDFRFGLKVTDTVTIKKFPKLDRFAARAGQPNSDFLNADLFATAFLKACEGIRAKIGVLLFEFSQFWPGDYEHGRDFVADLDSFLGKLPPGWPYAIEMRNRHWLRDEYLGCLARHGVTHVFNSWEAMPPIGEQMALPGSRTNPNLLAARFLLKPGRKYEDAVKRFQPYDKVTEPNPEARAAGKALIAEGKTAGPERKTFIYVNNRLEGNALETIEAMIDADAD